MYSYSTALPTVEKYDKTQYRVPFCIEQITITNNEGEEQQYRARTLFISSSSTNNLPILEERRNLITKELNKDVGTYINNHYDPGTQQTFQAMISMDNIPEEIKTSIKTIFPWIQSCLGYYYTKKSVILSSNNPELIIWDFTQFDTTKPDISLGSLV